MPDCNAQRLLFQGPGRRSIVASFDGGEIVSDGGMLVLQRAEEKVGVVAALAACFRDYREAERREHEVEELVRQRVFALAQGYEDLSDHDELRRDPLLASIAGKEDPTGAARRRERDRGAALAGKSTLQRLESCVSGQGERDRYRRMELDGEAVDRLFVDAFLASYEEAPSRIILDLDATDIPLHGQQEGRFFHGYYGHYCYLPLYVFCDSHLLCARLRPSNIDASAGSVEELERIVGKIRQRWPGVEIWVRADSGFAREELMRWCEDNDVQYVFGLARNARLETALEPTMERAEELAAQSEAPTRLFADLAYRTLDSWSRDRRVVGKAEILTKGPNPRFVVTSLPAERVAAAELYERVYCARGDMENRIKEQQLQLFATRTSAHQMRVNQVRLWLSAAAYVLLDAVRRIGLRATALARAECKTIRLKLLKIGAHIRISRRRVVVSLASSYPLQELFARACHQLQRAGPAIA